MAEEHEPELIAPRDAPVIGIRNPHTHRLVIEPGDFVEEDLVVRLVSTPIDAARDVLRGDTEDREPEEIVIRPLENRREEVDRLRDRHAPRSTGFVVPLYPVVVRVSNRARKPSGLRRCQQDSSRALDDVAEAYPIIFLPFSPLLRDGRTLSPPLLADVPSLTNVVLLVLLVFVGVIFILVLVLVVIFVVIL